MTQNLYATQQDVLAYLTANLGHPVYDTNYPAEEDEPMENGVKATYAVLRSNDATLTLGGGAVGGARYDEQYTLFDVLVVAADPDSARKVAYGPAGVGDVLTGYTPVDAGQLVRNPGGQVFVAGDGSGARPQAFIARVSFRCQVNMIIDGVPGPGMPVAMDDFVRSPDHSIQTIVTMTQAEYDALVDPDPTQLIVIVP